MKDTFYEDIKAINRKICKFNIYDRIIDVQVLISKDKGLSIISLEDAPKSLRHRKIKMGYPIWCYTLPIKGKRIKENIKNNFIIPILKGDPLEFLEDCYRIGYMEIRSVEELLNICPFK